MVRFFGKTHYICALYLCGFLHLQQKSAFEAFQLGMFPANLAWLCHTVFSIIFNPFIIIFIQ